MDRLALRLDMALQQFGGAQGLLARPLQQAIDASLVELARGAAARLVVQARHALSEPALPGLAHGADVEVLHLGHLATEQGLAQQQQGLGPLAGAPVR